MTFLQVLFSLFFLFFPAVPKGLREEFSWTRITYDWPKEQDSSIVFPENINQIATKMPGLEDPNPYIYENNIPMGANIWKNKLFISVPRRRSGVPSTLNFVWINSTQRHNVPLIPYPDWETNTLGGSGPNGYKFVSVYRVAIDPCDRLWFVDTGGVNSLGTPQQIQPTALVIMDLQTDTILQYHVFNSSLLKPASGLASITIDVTKDQCDDAFAYIPDLSGYGIIVYSLKEDKSWRVTHNYFYLEPLAGDFHIGGHRFQWNDGIFSIALTDINPDGYRDAYFHSMAGLNEYRVSTRVLRNETLATRSYHDDDFEVVGSKGIGFQTSVSDIDKSRGILFLNLVNQNALGCWSVGTPISEISIIQKDDEKMIYPSDLKVREDIVVVLTNSMPIFVYGTLDYDQVNFRVWVGSIETAIKGTKCEKQF